MAWRPAANHSKARLARAWPPQLQALPEGSQIQHPNKLIKRGFHEQINSLGLRGCSNPWL
jgi:hypothetical protein